MTRPRSQQINNLKTRYSRFVYTPTPESSQDVIAGTTVFASAVTDVQGGAESDTFATFKTPSAGPFPIIAGDTFSVALDGASPVNVVLANTDTTASRIAVKVIAALGGSYASASAGFLSIFSTTLGSAGSVTLADVVPGTLAKLGLSPGTIVGLTAPVRGIITKGPLNLGGKVLLKTTDGQNIVTDASSLILLSEGVLPPLRMVEKPGGIPVHARLTWAGSNFTFKYYASLPTRPELETFGGDFSLLDGTDTFDITVNDPDGGLAAGPITITFPSGPGLTRDQVVSRINELWANYNNTSGSGKAHISSTLTGPFAWTGIGLSDSIDVSVDGGSFQAISFTGDISATDVANEFNTAVTGATATVNSNGTIEFASDNNDGTTSSLEFRASGASYGLSNFFTNLGIQPGKYRGYFIAQASGPSEIKLFGIGRGVQATLDIASLNPTTLTRMGLVVGTYTGNDEGDEAVNFPVQDPLAPTSGSPIVALIPEVMDFGEVQVDEGSNLAQFENKGSGSARTQSSKNTYIAGLQTYGLGILDIGKPSALGPDGGMPSASLFQARFEYERFFRQFINGDFSARTVASLVAYGIEMPGTGGNPLAQSNEFVVDVDPGDSYPNKTLTIRFGRDGTSFNPLSVQQLTSSLTGGTRQLIAAAKNGVDLTAFSNPTDSLILHDVNTQAAGTATGGVQAIPMTSATSVQGDQSLRIMEVEEGNLEPLTLFRQVNSKWVATVGDGSISFGDFNGTHAIQDAIAFWTAHVSVPSTPFDRAILRIKVKRGMFNISAGNVLTVPDNTHLILEGEGPDTSFIQLTDGTSPAIVVNNTSTLDIRDIGVAGSGNDLKVQINSNCDMRASGMKSSRVHFEFNDGVGAHFTKCQVVSNNSGSPLLSILAGDGVEKNRFTFLDSEFVGGAGNPILKVGPGALSGITPIKRISFTRCDITCAGTTRDGATENLLYNTGVIDVDPGPNGSLTGAGGPWIREVEWVDCFVTGNLSAALVTVLIHLIPVANNVYTTASSFDVTTDAAMRIDKVTIRGGRWVAPRYNTVVNPVTIGLAVTGNTPDAYEFGRVVIEDWQFEFDTTGVSHVEQGEPTQDIDSFFSTCFASESGHPTNEQWGAVAISAMDLVMRDCRLFGLNQTGVCGDLFLKVDRRADIDGILIDQYVTGASGIAPDQRIRTRFGALLAIGRGFPNVIMKRVRVRGTNATSGSWVNHAIWYHEPSSTPVVIKDSELYNFQEAGSNHAHYGFQLVDAAQNGIWGSLFGNTGIVDHLVIDGLRASGHKYGTFFNRASGIDYFRRVTIRNCEFFDNTDCGFVFLAIGIAIGAFTFNNNVVTGNSPSATGLNCGVYIQAGEWVSSDPQIDPAILVMTGNQIYDNTNSSDGLQCRIITVFAVFSRSPAGNISGNNFSTSGIDGQLEINQIVTGSSSPLDSPANSISTPIRGPETGYRGNDGATYNQERYFDSGINMIQNSGKLLTP